MAKILLGHVGALTCVLLMCSLRRISACTDDFDCSLGGRCVQSVCNCFRAWKGVNCSELNLQASRNVRAFDRPHNQSSWGGSVIWDNETQMFHMFAADMTDHCGLDSWQHNSAIRHLVSKTPEGPYEPKEIVQSSFSHNPTVHKTPDGHYVIYHIGDGTNGNRPPITNCHNGTTPKTFETRAQASDSGPPPKIGSIITPHMLFSESLNGPWSTYRSSQRGTSCNNPAAYMFPNGTALLICKVMSPAIRVMAVARADHWKGPHTYAYTCTYTCTYTYACTRTHTGHAVAGFHVCRFCASKVANRRVAVAAATTRIGLCALNHHDTRRRESY